MTEYKFEPDYAVATGSILVEHCRENGISRAEFTASSGLPEHVVAGLLDGTKSMTSVLAQLLEQHTGISAQFWRNLDANCRASVERGARLTVCEWKDDES